MQNGLPDHALQCKDIDVCKLCNYTMWIIDKRLSDTLISFYTPVNFSMKLIHHMTSHEKKHEKPLYTTISITALNMWNLGI